MTQQVTATQFESIESELITTLESRPKLGFWEFLGAATGLALAWFAVAVEIKFPWKMPENLLVLVKLLICLFGGVSCISFVHILRLRNYFGRLEKIVREIKPIINSQKLSRSLKRDYILKRDVNSNPVPISISESYKHDGKLVVAVDRSLDLKLGTRLILEDSESQSLGLFIVDRATPEYWVARNSDIINGLWLAAMLQETDLRLKDYYSLYEVQ